MPRRKMIVPLPAILGDSPHGRFKTFAKALLAVPKSETIPIEEALAELEGEKRKIGSSKTRGISGQFKNRED